MDDENLLHPLIQAGLAKGRERIKRYKQMGIISHHKGLQNLIDLTIQQKKDFEEWKRKKEQAKAEKRLNARAELMRKING